MEEWVFYTRSSSVTLKMKARDRVYLYLTRKNVQNVFILKESMKMK